MSKYYTIKTRSRKEISWWRTNNKNPLRSYVEYEPIKKWSRFKINKDYNKTIDDIYEVHQMLKDLPEYNFYNSGTKEYYTRNTPINTFRLRKRKGGFREITVFSEEYKQIHLLLSEIYKDFFPYFPDSTGAYIKGKSQKETVMKHSRAKVHLSIDLKDFYPSIKTETLARILKKIAVVKHNLTSLSIERLSEMSTYGGALAQGSSISPILSNIYSIPLDHEMYEFVKGTNITYTRYADDLSLSSPNVIALPRKRELNQFIADIQSKLDRLYGGDLKINLEKVKLQFKEQIKVLGINIRHNDNGDTLLTVGKGRKTEYSRELFQLLCELNDNNTTDKLGDYQAIRGKIEYLKQFEPSWFDRQVEKLKRTFNFTGDIWDYILSKIETE